jgi:hypothetical protein
VGAATLTLLHWALREWYGPQCARRAALVLASLPLFYAGSQFGNMDLLVAATIAWTVLLAAIAIQRQERGAPYRTWLAAAYACAALGILAKGLIGAMLPGMVIVLWLALRGRFRTLLGLISLPGLALFALIVLPWPLAVERRYPGFLHYFIVVQHFQRFSGSGFNNVQPAWFYAPALLVLALPWSVWAIVSAIRARASGLLRDPRVGLLAVWLIAIAVFFSIPQSKLLGYIIPCTVPLAGLVAVLTSPTGRLRAAWIGSAVLAALICMGLVIGVALSHPSTSLPLARALAERGASEAPLGYVNGYWYDIPFYLHRRASVVAYTDWADPGIDQGDDWRKELADAGDFAPAAAAAQLQSEAALRRALCGGTLEWIVVDAADIPQHPWLALPELVAKSRRSELRRFDRGDPRVAEAAGCAAAADAPR